MKAKLSSNAKETENKLSTIQEERDSVFAHFHELKGEMMKSREKERYHIVETACEGKREGEREVSNLLKLYTV